MREEESLPDCSCKDVMRGIDDSSTSVESLIGSSVFMVERWTVEDRGLAHQEVGAALTGRSLYSDRRKECTRIVWLITLCRLNIFVRCKLQNCTIIHALSDSI